MSDKKTFTRGRKLAIGLNVLVVSLLAPCVGGLLVYLAFRPEVRTRLDLTAQQTYTLSERTQKVLAELKQEVDVYTCFKPDARNDSGMYVPGLDTVQSMIGTHCNDLLRELEVRSHGKLRAHAYSPDVTSHFARISELSQLIGASAVNVAVVAAGTRHRVLALDDLAAYDPGGQTGETLQRPKLEGFRDEESLVQAVLSVTEEKPVRIGFLRGHGEREPASAAGGVAALNLFARGLVAQNCQVAAVEIPAGRTITKEELDLLVIADPLKPLVDHEIDAIVRFAKEGGKLLLLLGPDAANSLDFPLLDQVYGLVRTPHPVCQVTVAGEWKRNADVFESDAYSPDRPIVKPLRARHMRTLWDHTTSLKALGRQEQHDVAAAPLVWTGNEAWIDLPDTAKKYNLSFDPATESPRGPLVLGYDVELKSGGRAVVLGCASVVDDLHLQQAPGNRDLGLNACDWLAEREQFIGNSAQPYYVTAVDLTPAEFNTIFLYVAAGIPALALLAGIAVFWMRRN